ncbi:cytochrome P450 [Annulohypoxylon moriforme]|nr:cytochrome P450 [Annulohypoxylon moriforme]
MELSFVDYIASRVGLLSSSCLLILAFIALSSTASDPIYAHFKRFGGGFFSWKPIHEVVEDGYSKVKGNEPFVVRWWANDFLVMPPKYLKDVKGAGWRHLSFFQNISNALYLHVSVGDLYTADSSQRMADVVKRGLNPQLPHLTSGLMEEISFSLDKMLGPCTDWREVKAMAFFGEIAHRIAIRVFIGEELCRNDTFIRQSSSLLESIFVTALVIAKLPLGPFRSLLAWPLSSVHRWKLRRSMESLRSVVLKRIKESREGSKTRYHDAIQWTLDLFPETAEVEDTDRFEKELLHNLWAGSSAPGGMITEVIYQLLLHQEDIHIIREESVKSVSQYGWSEKMLNSLNMLDSYIRETNRLFPTGSMTCVRTVLDSPFQFTDGLTLPVGCRFGFPAKAIQRDYHGLDDPQKFDGFRFSRRNKDEASTIEGERKWGASSVDMSNLPWGYGNHVCPGRFFAVRLVKLTIAKLLLDYEIKWDNEAQKRPPPVNVEGQFVPNMSQKISFKKRIN